MGIEDTKFLSEISWPFEAVSESQTGVAKLLKEPPEPAPQYIKAFDQWVSLKCWLDQLAADIWSTWLNEEFCSFCLQHT